LNPILRSGRDFVDILSALRISLAVFPFAASSNMATFVARPKGENTRFSRPGAKAYRHKKKVSPSKDLSQYVNDGSFIKYLTDSRGDKT
jgi:hypothetical protein